MNTVISYSIVALMVILLFTITDPFMYWMPNMMQTAALTLAAALLVVFAGLILREGAGDEREMLHRMRAGRAAFLSGIATLTIALVYQGFTHTIDLWIPLTLGIMVGAKLITRVRADRAN